MKPLPITPTFTTGRLPDSGGMGASQIDLADIHAPTEFF